MSKQLDILIQFVILEQIPLGAFVLQEDFTVLYWNSCLENWTKIPRSQIVGQPINLYFPHLMLPQYASRLQQLFSSGAPTIFSSQLHSSFLPCYRLDGKSLIQHTTATAVPRPGGYYALVLIQDVTDISNRLQQCRIIQNQALAEIQERKEAQEALSQKTIELELRNQQLTQLTQMSELLQACPTLKEAYQVIAESAQLLFPNMSGGVFVLNPTGNVLDVVVVWGDELSLKHSFTPNQCWAMRRGRAYVRQSFKSSLVCKHLQNPSAHYCCIPLMAQGEALGVLHLNSCQPDPFPEIQQLLAITVTEHISLALANIKLRETLEYERSHDPLTGLFNRRYLEEYLELQIHRAQYYHQSLGLIMLEVDEFRQVHLSLGLKARDTLLRELGLFLQTHLRPCDLACRYEHKELTLILPNTDLETTYQQAQRLQQEFKLLHHDKLLGQITLSLGVACFPNHGLMDKAILQSAYTALTQAKQEGGDRIIIAH